MTNPVTTLPQLLCCERDSSSVVAVNAHTHYLWRDYLGSVRAVMTHLAACSQQRWLLHCDDAYQFAVGFMALLHSAKTIILPPNLQSGTLRELSANAEAVLTSDNLGDIAMPIVNLEHCINGGNSHYDSNDIVFVPLSAQLTIEVLTSGSQGNSKSIVKELQHFDAEIQGLEGLWGELLTGSLLFSTVSHQHIYGLLFRVLWPLCVGRIFVSQNYQYPESLFADMGAIKSTFGLDTTTAVLTSSPAHLKRIPSAIDLVPLQKTVTAVFCSGGPLAAESALNIKHRLGLSPLEVFGSSETGGVAWRVQESAQADTQWQPFKAVEIRVANQQGLLEIRSPFCFTKQWFAMGDTVDLGADGRFYLKGRTDRIVKIEEKRLSLTQMEKRLLASGWVKEVRVLPLDGSRTVVAVVAVASEKALFLLQSEGKRALNEQIKRYLLQFFERVLLPRKFRYVHALPINEQGKVVLADLKAMFDPYYVSEEEAFSTSNAPQPPITRVERQPDKLLVVIDLPTEHEVFAGHFPQWPILPGVVQLDIAARQARYYFYPDLLFKSVERLKFQSVIRPGSDLQLLLQRVGEGKVFFCYSRTDKELSRGIITFN